MSRSTPRMRVLAERLVGFEGRGTKASEMNPPAGAVVCEKLRPVLGTLIGDAGFHALLSRALVRAQIKTSALRGVEVTANGNLEGFGDISTPADSKKMAEGSIALVSALLGLLEAFIGEDLTVRFVREVWPKISFNDPNSGNWR